MPRPSKRKDVITPVNSNPKRGQTQHQNIETTMSDQIRPRVNSTNSIATSVSMSSNVTVLELHQPDQTFEGTNTGKMRDVVEILIHKRNEEPMATHISHGFAFNVIFKNLLPRNMLNSINLGWKGKPYLEFKLNSKVDIDKFEKHFVVFDERVEEGKKRKIKYDCEVIGVRSSDEIPTRKEDEDPEEPWVRWVKLEGAGFCQKRADLVKWLEYYGSTYGVIEEESIEIVDENPEAGEETVLKIGNGILTVKMKIEQHIPQFLPINGRKVKVYYRGIPKLCTKCFEEGHFRQDCANATTTWLEYVSNFIETHDHFDESLFGKWKKIASKWRLEQNQMSTRTPPTRGATTTTAPRHD